VIERHENPDAGNELEKDYALHAGSSPAAEVIHLASVLAGASIRADDNDEGAWTAAEEDLREELAAAVEFADDWEEWESTARSAPPGTLLLVAHVAEDKGMRYLELGAGSRRDVLGLSVPQQVDGPLVILLGCETGSGAQPLQDFTTGFLTAGAKTVISTFTLVRGRWAAPLGVALVRALRSIAADEEPNGGMRVGDALLRVRRRELVRNPMVLAILGFGDADYWIEP